MSFSAAPNLKIFSLVGVFKKMIAYVSRRCSHSASFVRLVRERKQIVRIVTVEESAQIPWYIDTVPTLVVRTKDGIDIYAADDAFEAMNGRRARPNPIQNPNPSPTRLCAKHNSDETRSDSEQEQESDPEPEPGGETAMFENTTGDDLVQCSGDNYECLINEDAESAMSKTTRRTWERTLREEADSKEANTDTADKRLERMMQTRGEQQQQQVAASRSLAPRR
jgi:hypothetical protein